MGGEHLCMSDHRSDPPRFPFAPPPSEAALPEERASLLDELASQPAATRRAADSLAGAGLLDAPYRDWTGRQIVHHIGHSHANAFCRVCLALTEDSPTIRPYNESLCSGLAVARTGDIGPALALLDGLHAAWSQMLASVGPKDWERAYVNPEAGPHEGTMTLGEHLAAYVWHGKHHTAQLEWIGANR